MIHRFKYLLIFSYIFSSLFGLNGIVQILEDYQKGELTLEESLIYQVARLKSDPILPDRYKNSEPIKCGTPVLKALMENYHKLSPSGKEILSKMGVNFNGLSPTFPRPSDLDLHYDSGIFRFHYTLTGEDAVDLTDDDNDGIPDYINTVDSVFTEVYEMEIDTFSFVEPPSDSWYPYYVDNGGNGLYDIYISKLSPGYYGWVMPESYAFHNSGDNEKSPDITEQNALTSYMEIRNNYNGFQNTEIENIQVTAAHEFFHAIQFGYDGWEKTWLLEATAVWMEDEVFDDVNDYYQYLQIWFNEPNVALDYSPYHNYNPNYNPEFDTGGNSRHWYGSCIFFRYISEHIGDYSLIRTIFENSILYNSYEADYTITTIDEILSKHGSDFKETLQKMAVANRVLSSDPIVGEYSYEEAENYKAYGVELNIEASISIPDSPYAYISDDNLMRYASHYLQINPVNIPIEVTFFPDDLSSSFQVSGILEKKGGEVMVIPIGTSRILPGSDYIDEITISVMADDTKGLTNSYSLVLSKYPEGIVLYPCYPNPFWDTTTFSFYIPHQEQVSLILYDILGRRVDEIVNKEYIKGYNMVSFTHRYLPSGIYIAQIKTGNTIKNQKITLIK